MRRRYSPFSALFVCALLSCLPGMRAGAAPRLLPNATSTVCPSQVIASYYGSWFAYNQDNGVIGLQPEDLNATLYTHVYYAFASINASTNSIKFGDSYLDPTLMSRFTASLTSRNPCLTPMLAIGGWSEGVDTFTAVTATATTRKAFINSTITFARKYGFGGVDVDWEYPTAITAVKYSSLLSEMKAAFITEAAATNRAPLVLSVAIPTNPVTLTAGYNMTVISAVADIINLMAYDFNGNWLSYTAPHTQLYTTGATAAFTADNTDSAVNYLLNKGVPTSKLVLGLATYGYAWNITGAVPLPNGKPPKYGVSGTSNTPLGPVSQTPGLYSYRELYDRCWRLRSAENRTSSYVMWGHGCSKPNSNATAGDLYIDTALAVAYGTQDNGTTWVTFDNPSTIATKLQYGISRQLAGAFTWSVRDDVSFKQNSSVHSLQAVVYNTLRTVAPFSPSPSPSPSVSASPVPYPVIVTINVNISTSSRLFDPQAYAAAIPRLAATALPPTVITTSGYTLESGNLLRYNVSATSGPIGTFIRAICNVHGTSTRAVFTPTLFNITAVFAQLGAAIVQQTGMPRANFSLSVAVLKAQYDSSGGGNIGSATANNNWIVKNPIIATVVIAGGAATIFSLMAVYAWSRCRKARAVSEVEPVKFEDEAFAKGIKGFATGEEGDDGQNDETADLDANPALGSAASYIPTTPKHPLDNCADDKDSDEEDDAVEQKKKGETVTMSEQQMADVLDVAVGSTLPDTQVAIPSQAIVTASPLAVTTTPSSRSFIRHGSSTASLLQSPLSSPPSQTPLLSSPTFAAAQSPPRRFAPRPPPTAASRPLPLPSQDNAGLETAPIGTGKVSVTSAPTLAPAPPPIAGGTGLQLGRKPKAVALPPFTREPFYKAASNSGGSRNNAVLMGMFAAEGDTPNVSHSAKEVKPKPQAAPGGLNEPEDSTDDLFGI